MKKTRILLLAVLVAMVIGFFAFHLDRYVDLRFFKSQQAAIDAYHRAHPLVTAILFFIGYVVVTGLSLPGAAVMSLAVGAVFGLLWGTVLVSFASTIGATLAFLVSRFVLREAVQRRFGRSLATVNRGVERDGAFYLFALRLVPVFPFFVINLLMGLTPMRAATFYWVSQAGMLAGTVVYVNAGTRLASVDSVSGILSPGLLGSFLLLGVFPLIARRTVDLLDARRRLRGFARPRSFDRNLVVIGGGSAGLTSAYIAAAVKARVTLIEEQRMGGDCLYTGCVPSKALLRTARFLARARRAQDYGVRSAEVEFDFGEVMERVQRVIRSIEPHDSADRYEGLGVECIEGRARIVSPWAVQVHGRTLTTRAVVIATGARPHIPPIPGIEDTDYLSSETVWALRELPRRLLVLGGGPIGCELAQAFARLGSRVIQVERLAHILPLEDPDISRMVEERFRAEGIDVRAAHDAKEFRAEDGTRVLMAEHQGAEVRIEFDRLLVATGRSASTEGYGLEELGIAPAPGDPIEVDEYLRTRMPGIYACGDVIGPYRFTHVASHQAYYAVVNALFGTFRKVRADYSVIPWATFTEPEVARVGLNETEAQARGIPYEVTTFDIGELERAVVEEEAFGVVKLLTAPRSDRVLGATIVGQHAGDIIAEYVSAMRHGLGLNKILRTIHIYPTLAEANRYAAGQWKRSHVPAGVLELLARYHRWRRGGRQARVQGAGS